MDIRPNKLQIFAAISRQIGAMMDSPVRITSTTDAVAALDGCAGYLVIRPEIPRFLG
jgi:alpha-galactosidase/6-phospho-beta-glucosidase family protein